MATVSEHNYCEYCEKKTFRISTCMHTANCYAGNLSRRASLASSSSAGKIGTDRLPASVVAGLAVGGPASACGADTSASKLFHSRVHNLQKSEVIRIFWNFCIYDLRKLIDVLHNLENVTTKKARLSVPVIEQSAPARWQIATPP